MPLLTTGGESIMINVATSGGLPKTFPSWFESIPTTRIALVAILFPCSLPLLTLETTKGVPVCWAWEILYCLDYPSVLGLALMPPNLSSDSQLH
eukprot:scaffold16275_cov53-Attheya_sp.AAC.1